MKRPHIVGVQIGKGAFGTAHIVQHKVTGERFVLKRVRLARQSAKERQCSVRELLLLSNLRHRNVLEFKGCWLEGGCNLCMLVELCESGDLFTQLRLRAPSGVHFSEEHLQEMAVQLLSAVDYLHRSGIAHRDIKSSNVLITGEGCLKLADFGLSLVVDTEAGGMTKTMVGTPNYMSPDVLHVLPTADPTGAACTFGRSRSVSWASAGFSAVLRAAGTAAPSIALLGSGGGSNGGGRSSSGVPATAGGASPATRHRRRGVRADWTSWAGVQRGCGGGGGRSPAGFSSQAGGFLLSQGLNETQFLDAATGESYGAFGDAATQDR